MWFLSCYTKLWLNPARSYHRLVKEGGNWALSAALRPKTRHEGVQFHKNRCLTIASFSEAPIDSRLFLGLWSGQRSVLWQYRRQLALLTCRRKHTGRCTGHHPQAAPLVKHGMYLLTHLLIRTLVFFNSITHYLGLVMSVMLQKFRR